MPNPVDLSDPRIKLGSSALQVDSLPTELSGKPNGITGDSFCVSYFFNLALITKKSSYHFHNWKNEEIKINLRKLSLFTHFKFCNLLQWACITFVIPKRF